MKINSKKKLLDKIHIVGGGPAGLSVGYYANKLDIDVSVFEASGSIGGNCKTLIDGEFRYDTGAHRLHDKNKSITKEIKKLLGNDLKRVASPSKIYYKQKFYNFPIKVSDLVSNLSFFIIVQIIFENIFIRLRRKDSIKHFRDLAYSSYGKTISEMFLIPYTEKLWGDDARNLDTSITGGRLKELNLKSLIKDMVKPRANDSDHMEGVFYYPKLGFGEIFNALGLRIGMDKIFLNREISRINHDNEKILSFVDSNGNITDVDNLVFTVKEASQSQKQTFTYLQSLTEQLSEINKNSRELDKKLSNFLSTQLNIQSNILNLTNELNKDGIIDKSSKKYFENIDKGIQKLVSNLKKK